MALRRSLQRLPALQAELAPALEETSLLGDLLQRLDPLPDLADLPLEAGAGGRPPGIALTEGGLLRDGYDARVDELRLVAREGRSWVTRLEQRERERTGIQSLKVGYNQVFGYYIEITHANRDQVPPDYQRKQTLKTPSATSRRS